MEKVRGGTTIIMVLRVREGRRRPEKVGERSEKVGEGWRKVRK